MTSSVYRLTDLGWDDFFEFHFESYKPDNHDVGRVAVESKQFYRLYTKHGELLAQVAGKLRHEATRRSDFPAVGDWVVIRSRPEDNTATIHAVLPRKSKFVRKVAGSRTEEQVVGANIDTVFLMTSLNQDFNLRRIERYLTVAWESGANPVIVLSKSDLSEEIEERLEATRVIAGVVPAHAVTVVRPDGLDELRCYFKPGKTVALLGSSGVGKSSLINHLLDREALRVQEVREDDDRGRHTTTHRELIVLPQGGMVLDTPGMRELQLWDSGGGLHATFEDIEAVARLCYFADCCHQYEPRCAVREALESGSIDPERYLSYEKLQKELNYLVRKRDIRASILEKNKWKKLSRLASERGRMKRR